MIHLKFSTILLSITQILEINVKNSRITRLFLPYLKNNGMQAKKATLLHINDRNSSEIDPPCQMYVDGPIALASVFFIHSAGKCTDVVDHRPMLRDIKLHTRKETSRLISALPPLTWALSKYALIAPKLASSLAYLKSSEFTYLTVEPKDVL